MITKLTKKQVNKFPKYVAEWTQKGLTTEQQSLENAIIDFGNFQKLILKKEKIAPVVILDSPTQCWIAVCMMANLKNLSDSQVSSQVESQVSSQVWSQVRSQVSSQIKDFIYPYFDCQFWAGWFSFYEFLKNEVGISFSNEKEYNAFKDCQKYGMAFPLDELCIVCQPPTIIKKNENGLHCTDGPALSYNGDNEIYALNGVSMPKEYVLTGEENITAEMVMKETNVEIRRELLRKVGIERILNDLPHKVLDTVGNYELYSLDLSDELKNCKYLKMTNPSVGCFHLEGIEPSVNTVAEALKWRNNNMFVDAEILT